MSQFFAGGVWPYPLWIAHRGAGKLAPENTLAAFRVGAAHSYRMFECDVKLSADDVPFLLHDATLTRTCLAFNSQKTFFNQSNLALDSGASSNDSTAGDLPWSALSQLDAGSWHSRAFAGEPLPTLGAVARYCILNGYFLNIEIKPTPGSERHTGEVVAQYAAQLWQGQKAPPLLTSFSVAALEGAQAAQPEMPRGLLLDTLWPDWLKTAQRLACVAVVCNHLYWDRKSLAKAKAAGLRTLSYTVNDESIAERLLDMGLDGIITDRIDLFAP
jgi:glycerophosphoryl diester phosphodiesterase